MTFSIPVPIYNVYINVYVSSKEKQLHEWDRLISAQLDDKPDAEFGDTARTYQIYVNQDGFACCDIVFNESKFNIHTINHELFHATVSILRRAGLHLEPESEEAYAYLMDHISRSFFMELNKKQWKKLWKRLGE